MYFRRFRIRLCALAVIKVLDDPVPRAVRVFLAVDAFALPVGKLEAFVGVHRERADIVLDLLAWQRSERWHRQRQRDPCGGERCHHRMFNSAPLAEIGEAFLELSELEVDQC